MRKSVEPGLLNVRRFYPFIIPFLLLLASSAGLDAQSRNSSDHRGTEFRLAFLHTNGDGEFPSYYVTISSETPGNSGTLTYEETGETIGISIPQANRAVRFRLDTFNLLMPDPAAHPDSAVSRRTLTIRFNEEVTVYAINTLRWSSDGFLALPIDALGREYTIMSYPNTSEPGPAGQVFNTSDFPSQFAVIATQNGTRIQVFPTTSVNGRGSTAAYTVNLNVGEVYFGQAIESRGFPRPDQLAGKDLTGTRIESNLPVVVYGSHQRSNIPWTEAVGRDHLVEQMPPTDHWGTRAMVTPHFQLPKTVNDSNFVRIIAARAGTVVTVDSGVSFTLVAGNPVQIPLHRAMLLTANQPISVAQFQSSTVDVQLISRENDTVGDPFMMLIPSREQFDTNYSFESWSTKDFLHHFINVVIPTQRISTLRINGSFPTAARFIPIPKTSYSYAQIDVDPGPHHVQAEVPFGLYMYGYGPYNSYGMPGGWVFDSIYDDHIEPDITWRDTCGGVVGEAFDSGPLDFGMEDLRLEPGSSNVELLKEPFERGADSVHFMLRLLDPYRDGVANLLAVDSAGLERRYRVQVRGFTVRLARGEPIVRLDTLASLNGEEFCTTIALLNYGGSQQRVNGLRLRDPIPGLRIVDTFPIVLQPGEMRNIRICFQRTGDTAALIEIGIDNGCEVRPVGTLPVVSGVDSTAPSVVRVSGECDKDVIFEVSEEGALNSGIAEITVRAQKNADLTLPLPSDLPGKSARIEIRRKSIWEDVVYDIEIVDVVGNRIRLADTIGGLTLSVADGSNTELFGYRFDPPIPWLYDELVFTRQDCDTVWLQNTGLRPLDLYRLRFSGNLQFSIPPEQLPLFLEPGERVPVEVCVRPTASGEFSDTLMIEFFCGELIDVVEFQSLVRPLTGNGRDRCGNLIETNIGGATRGDFIDNPLPNPSPKGVVALTFGLSETRPVTLTLHDAKGVEVLRFLDGDVVEEGISRIHADLTELSTGRYFLHMDGPEGAFVQPILIQE